MKRTDRDAAVRTTLVVASALLASVLVLGPTSAASAASVVSGGGGGEVPDGFVSGAPHALRIRPVIGMVAAAPKGKDRSAAGQAIARFGAGAVTTCDLTKVTAVDAIPTTGVVDDEPGACVLNEADARARKQRFLLGASRITGSDIASVRARTWVTSKQKPPPYSIEMELTDRGAAAFAADPNTTGLVTVVDGTVLRGDLTTTASSGASGEHVTLTLLPDDKLSRAEAERIVDTIQQARSEEVIGFADQVTMTDGARELFGSNTPEIVDKADFRDDCPTGKDQFTYVLGCQGDDQIYLLRVDRPDLAAIMPVTAAHEMLHAAYAQLDPQERRRINRLLDDAYESVSDDQRLREVIAEYDEVEPGQRHNELHSILPTEVADLSPALERYYERYFEDRSTIIDAFNGYQGVFDALQAQHDQLSAEVEALDAQLTALEPQAEAAGAEADRLASQIDALRRQGRIGESNDLVGPQNAAVNEANALAAQYNALVGEYNAKVDALNALAITAQQIDAALGVEVAPT